MSKKLQFVNLKGSRTIYQVEEHPTDSRLFVIVYNGKRTPSALVKEDCEPYEFPIEQSLDEQINEFKREVQSNPNWEGDKDEVGKLAHEYCKSTGRFLGCPSLYIIEESAFTAGYKAAKSNYATGFDAGFKQAQRNLPLISEPQSRELADEYVKDREKFAEAYVKDYYPIANSHMSGLRLQDYRIAFDEGYNYRERTTETPLEEGQHLITTEQLKQIYDCTSTMNQDELEEWFPLVFAPEKTTYKVGDRFTLNNKNLELILALVNFQEAALIRLNGGTAWTTPVKIKDSSAITEDEFNEIAAGYSFTLLPETTNQN